MAAAAQRNPSKIMSMNPDRLSDSDAKYQHLASSKAGVPLLNYAWVVTSLIQARLSLDTNFAAVAKYFLLEGEKSGKNMYALILQSLCRRNRRWDLIWISSHVEGSDGGTRHRIGTLHQFSDMYATVRMCGARIGPHACCETTREGAEQ